MTQLLDYTSSPLRYLPGGIPSFVDAASDGADPDTVNSFGDEWERFNEFDQQEIEEVGNRYFALVKDQLTPTTKVLDVGCGSGRWDRYLASRVGLVEGVDPSKAVFVAHRMNAELPNVRITHAGVAEIPFKDDSFDIAISLGVLHHIPDTGAALARLTRKVKPGGLVLIYLYYNFENRGWAFKCLHSLSEGVRGLVSRSPKALKVLICEFIALTVYWPLARIAAALKQVFPQHTFWRKIPLSFYHDRSFYVMRNDSLDRFGTPLEQRFSRQQIRDMMSSAGLSDIKFSELEPFWCAVGTRA